jgi:hypothetical protein
MNADKKRCHKCTRAIQNEDSLLEGLHTSCFCDWFQVDIDENFQDIIARPSEVTSHDWARITSSFFHGKFRKYSARLGQKSYLLKVQQEEFPELPAMEYLCNQIARHLGLWVPHHFFIRFQNELDTFVCENFMQDYPGCNLVHIYRFLEKPDQFSCEGLLHVLEREVKKLDEIQRLVTVCLFDALIGNHDRHGRNLGLIQSGSELYLAPFYDNPSYIALEHPKLLGALHEPRGAIVTRETSEPSMRDYVKEWIRLGFTQPIIDFKQRIKLEEIHDLIKSSFVSLKRQQAFINLTKRRYEELCDATQTV